MDESKQPLDSLHKAGRNRKYLPAFAFLPAFLPLIQEILRFILGQSPVQF